MYTIIGADGLEYGPVTEQQLRQWIAEGRANAQTKVRVAGATDWKPLSELPEFSLSFAVPPPPTGAAPAPFVVSPIPQTNGMAVTSLVLGIISVTLGCCCYGLPFNIAGIIFAIIALSQINQDPLNQRGKGMAIAGLVLCILSFVLAAFGFLLGMGSGWMDAWRRLNHM